MGVSLHPPIQQTTLSQKTKHLKITTNHHAKGIRTHQTTQAVGRAQETAGFRRGRNVRPQVVKALWAHIKANKLQDPDNKQYFTPDKAMEGIFGTEKIRAFGMAKFLKGHLG